MNNFAKSILNYFAAYNETRFRFTTKAIQKWSNNQLTLDFSIFPDFENELLRQLKTENSINIQVKPKQFIISLDGNEFHDRLEKRLIEYGSSDTINNLREELEITENDLTEVYRQWNLGFRKLVGDLLLDLQEEKKQELIASLDIEYLPMSTLNTARIEQEIFEQIRKIETKPNNPEDFLNECKLLVTNFKPELVMFDLFSLIQAFHLLSSSNTINLFLHDFSYEEIHYPIATIEMQISPDTNVYLVRSTRDLVQLNTPAINSSKMGKVLTTPRACSIADLSKYITAIEMYFQAYYHHTNQFFFSTNFKKLVGSALPTIAPRIGLQIIEKEDRKLLDYSELITNIESGSGKKFADIIETYVDDNVENTTREVHDTFTQEYPHKSPKNFYSDIPLNLNSNQKKILTAAKNPKNQVMVIDGPPGTGKSYTITALVYLANLLNKKVLITSHKPQALDVVEETLTNQFRQVHPYAKPPILRLTKPDESTLNSIDNTLSDSVINQTLNRTHQINVGTVTEDLDVIEKQFSDSIKEDWDTGYEEHDQLLQVSKLANYAAILGIPLNAKPIDVPIKLNEIKEVIINLSSLKSNIGLSDYIFLSKNLNRVPNWITALNKIGNHNSNQLNLDLIGLDQISDFVNILETLLSTCNITHQLKDLSLEDKFELPKISQLSKTLSWVKLVEVRDLVKKLHNSNKQLATKFFGSEEKRRLEHTLKIDYPEIYNEANKNCEEVLFTLERDIELVNKTISLHPWLNRDYVLKQSPELAIINELLENIVSENYSSIHDVIKTLAQKNLSELTVKEIYDHSIEIQNKTEKNDLLNELTPLLTVFNQHNYENNKLSDLLEEVEVKHELFNENISSQLTELFSKYSELLSSLNIDDSNLSTLTNLFVDDGNSKIAREYIDLYQEISNNSPLSLRVDLLEKQQEKRLRLLMNKNEERFAELNKYPKDVQRILTAVKTNQRLTLEQSLVIFEHVPCIIAPPDLISQYFPMENDMIDWLIIDEASQVSIAESLSLMLRAKQTIVFGDELQYGAVGATNVNLEYSKEYFRNVLDDYVKDKHEQISDEVLDQIATDVSRPINEDEIEVNSETLFRIDPNTKEWLKTFNIRTSTLDFAKAIRNYSDSLTVHFRSYPELISYSNDFFYKPSEINLVTSRIRTKPIAQTIEFIKVDTKGFAGNNINLDEIDVIKNRLNELYVSGFTGSLGIICSFREQTDRMKDILRKDLEHYSDLVEKNNLKIWFVGDVQGEERDIIFYSFVEDKKINNASLSTIYPVVGGVADNIRNLRMQRLNVGFSRAKDTMVFIHSMDIKEYKDTRLGDALEHYWKVLNETTDNYIADTNIFGSKAEEKLYSLLTQTSFYKQYQNNIRLIAQFEIGKYLKEEFRRYIPNYRVDFLLTLTVGHKEHSLIIEYDGIEFHTKSPYSISSASEFDQEYIEYDIQRQLELESYGYHFLRINKFTLRPANKNQTEVDVLDNLLFSKMESALEKLHNTQISNENNGSYRTKDHGSEYYSDKFKSPMEEKLDEIIRNTEFYREHQSEIQLLPNFILKTDEPDTYPKHLPEYKVDFFLKLSLNNEVFKLIIEYDGAKYHSEGIDESNNEAAFSDALTDDHLNREQDIKDLGYRVIRLNKFNLFSKESGKTPEEIVDDMLKNELNSFQEGIKE